MAVPDIGQVADAIAAELNGSGPGWSQAFTAVRTYYPLYELEELTTVKVAVVPRGMPTNERLTRGPVGTRGYQRRQEFRIDVGVQFRPEDVSNAQMDPWVFLAQQIRTWFEDAHLIAGLPYARALQATIDPYPAQEHTELFGMMSAVVQLTVEVIA